VAWSPDGLLVAIPEVEPQGFSVYRVESGALLRTFAGASRVSWSPDGRWLAFYLGDEAPGLYVVDAGLGEPRKLTPTEPMDALPRPVWERDGRSILVVRTSTDRPRDMPLGAGADLVIARVRLDGAPPAVVHEMAHPPIARLEALRRVSLTADSLGESLFYSVEVEGEPTRITWLLRGRDEIYKQIPSIDESLPIGALAIDPSQRLLAARYGGFRSDAPLAVLEVDRMMLTPLAPDDPARFAWLDRLTGALATATAPRIRPEPRGGRVPGEWTVRRSRGPGAPPAPGRRAPVSVERATILPMPAELDPNLDLAGRLDRIARIGLKACAAPLGPDPTGMLAQRLAEARLAFTYLNPQPSGEHLRDARRLLDEVAAGAASMEERERLSCVRVQLDLAEGEKERAALAIDDLMRIRGAAVSEMTEVPGRPPLVSEVPDPLAGWLACLSASIPRPSGVAGNAAMAVTDMPPMPLIPGAEPPGATVSPVPEPEPRSRSAFRPVFPDR
jgi:hypothetical protein